MRKFSLLLAFLMPLMIFPQEKDARQQIRNLKNSILLVRLRTSDNKIKALEQAGYTEDAKETREKQRKENLKITKAFTDEFNFCPVYFFYSSATTEIKAHHFGGYLLDAGLKPVKGISKPVADFFVAEFTQIERSQGKYYENTTLEKNEEGYGEKRDNYYGSPDLGFNALVIRDSSFHQLQEPFPFYVKTSGFLPIFKRKPEKVVKKLNENLSMYYKSVKH